MIESWTSNQESSGIARMSKLCGHSMGTAWPGHSMDTPSVSRNASGRKSGAHSRHEITHSEIASEAVFGHKYHSFSLTCMLASYPHETCIAHDS